MDPLPRGDFSSSLTELLTRDTSPVFNSYYYQFVDSFANNVHFLLSNLAKVVFPHAKRSESEERDQAVQDIVFGNRNICVDVVTISSSSCCSRCVCAV